MRFFHHKKEEKRDWKIVCGPANPNWSLSIGNCTKEHAESVLAHLLTDPTVPDDLELRKA